LQKIQDHLPLQNDKKIERQTSWANKICTRRARFTTQLCIGGMMV
jgi:hypothetical protein